MAATTKRTWIKSRLQGTLGLLELELGSDREGCKASQGTLLCLQQWAVLPASRK